MADLTLPKKSMEVSKMTYSDSKRKQRARLYKRGMTHLQVVIDDDTRRTLDTLKRRLRLKRKTGKIVKMALELLLDSVSENTITT